MDPGAHTLAGALLAQAGLKRSSRYATPTLLIGVNLPDIDAAVNFISRDLALYYRRGWTHGILAMAVLPLVLACGIWLWHRWRGSETADSRPFRGGMILALSYLAVLSHPLLDWLNTYGIRLLMPFDGTWFYGDTLFIVDPWFWLLAAAGIMLARPARRREVALWSLVALLATGLIMSTPRAALAAKALWLAGIGLIAGARWLAPQGFGAAAARACGAFLLLYIAAAWGVARLAERGAAQQVQPPLEVMADPTPGMPVPRRIIRVYPDRYEVFPAGGGMVTVPRQAPGPVVRAAMNDDSIRGFMQWVRYPHWEVRDGGEAWTVEFRDLRYQAPYGEAAAGIGVVSVTVPKSGDGPQRVSDPP